MNSPRNAVGALEEEMRQGWLRNGGFAQGRATAGCAQLLWLSSAPAPRSSSLTSRSVGDPAHFPVGFWHLSFRKQLLIADALCRPRNFLQG